VHNPRAPGAEAQLNRNKERRRAALLNNWDPSGIEEKVNWYQEFVQRHAPQQVSWFQDAGHEDDDDDGHSGTARREATGAGILYGADGLASKLVAPLDDGSIKVWDADADAHSSSLGRAVAKSEAGVLSNRGPDLDLDRATRLAQSQAIMTDTGAVECVSIDSGRQKAFFAVQNTLNEVDLHTLQLVSRTPFPFPITALSEAHHSTPLTVGTNWTLHLHDTRKPPPSPSHIELLNASASSPSFSRLDTGDFAGHVCLSQPGALSIAHSPPGLGDANGDIWVSGRFTSLLNFDRRFFPRLRGTVHSGARISSLHLLPTPFIPHTLRLGAPYAPPSLLHSARATGGITLFAAGEYKGKGSLEAYSLSPAPEYAINSADSRTARNAHACYLNRQTASASKLLSVCGQGTRIVFADGEGNVKWVERDASTPVRQFNINESASASNSKSGSGRDRTSPCTFGITPGMEEEGAGDMVQRILPTLNPSLLSPLSNTPPSSDSDPYPPNLILWTTDGNLGLLGFGREKTPLFDADVFQDALEQQVSGDAVDRRAAEREYGIEMRRALELQAREVRWLRGYGL
jgi:hypothetical protein